MICSGLRFRAAALTCMFLLCLSSSNPLFAQSSGKISGRVVAADSREPLIGVNVYLEGIPQIGTVTDADGRYFLLSVPPGTHTVVLSYIGFSTVRIEDVSVHSGRNTEIDGRMQEETLAGEEIVIMAERPLVVRDRTSSVSFVDREAMETLPVQEIGDLVRYQPGVVAGNGGFHFRGGRTRETAYLVDGIPVQDVFNQGGGNTVDVEVQSIQELQVFTGTFDAEMGGAQSGVVSVTTRDPSDKLEGSIRVQTGGYTSFSNDTFLDGSRFDPLESSDVSVTLSGPLFRSGIGMSLSARYEDASGHLKGERRFLSSDGLVVESYRQWYRDRFQPDDTRLIALDEATDPEGNPVTYADGSPLVFASGDGQIVDMSWSRAWTLNPKFTFRPTSRSKMSLSAIYNDQEGQGYDNSRRFSPDNRSRGHSRSLTTIMGWRQTFGRNVVWNVNASYKAAESESSAFDSMDDPRVQYLSATDTETGFSLGATDNGASRSTEEQFIFKTDVLWQLNNWNEAKAGIFFRTNRFVIEDLDRSWVFADDRDSLFQTFDFPNGLAYPDFADYLTEVQQRLPVLVPELDAFAVNDRFDQQPAEFAAFIQDKLEFKSQWVVKAGVRYERFDVNEQRLIDVRTPTDRIGRADNLEDTPAKSYLSPRLGISFPISATGAFRVAYGHFVQMPAYREMFKNPVFEDINVGRLEGREIGNPDLKPERTIKYEMGLQQQIGSFLAMDISLYYKNIRNLLGLEILGTLDNVQYTRTVNRDYGLVRGTTIGLTVRPMGPLLGAGFDVSYSNARGSSSNPFDVANVVIAGRSGEVGGLFVDRQIIPLDWDQRLTANLSANVGKRGDWNVGLISQLSSGQPYTPAFLDPGVQFPDNEFRNAQRKPLLFTLDMSAEKRLMFKTVQYALRLQVNNVFNRLNERVVDSVSGRAEQIVRLPSVQADRDEVREVAGLFSLAEDNARPHWYSTPREILLAISMSF